MRFLRFVRHREADYKVLDRANAPPVIDPRINEIGAFAFAGKPVHLWHGANVPDRCSAIIPGCEALLRPVRPCLPISIEIAGSVP